MKTVFVTGATGVLGSALIPLYLDEPDTELRLLIRAESPRHLHQRVNELFEFWGLQYDTPLHRRRVVPLRGDVTLPDFGLCASDYRSVAGEVTNIVHAAANVNMKMTESEANRISVDSTNEVLKLAEKARRSGKFEKLDYISTLGIAGKKRGHVPETEDLGPRAFHTAYEASKAKAEEYVTTKMKDGLPVTIHRPSMIVGASSDGKIRQFQVFYYICEFLTGRYSSGFLPDTGSVRIDVIPVDTVARVLKWSSGTTRTTGRILHVCTGHERAPTASLIGEKVRATWFDDARRPAVREIPLPIFRFLASAMSLVSFNRRKNTLENLRLLLAHLDADQGFENHSTLRLLHAAGIELPEIELYLPNVFRYYLSHRKI